MQAIMDSQIETGTPYILYKDACNKKSNQKNIGTIKSSNLCSEIIEYSDDKETAVCNLASISINRCLKKAPEEKEKLSWTIYTKTDCRYCKYAKNLMNFKNIKFKEIENADIKTLFNKEEITYPQICYEDAYGKVSNVGGFTELLNF